MTKIFLLGFMGSGKSYVGKRLAEHLKADFLDLDELIVQKSGQSILEIFQQCGEEYFRQAESDCLKSLAKHENLVLALGGGTPCFFDNMDWVNDHGVSIYLKTSSEVLATRLKKETAKRPLIEKLSAKELPNFIENKVAEREAFYHQAHLEYVIKTGHEPIVEELTKFLISRTK